MGRPEVFYQPHHSRPRPSRRMITDKVMNHFRAKPPSSYTWPKIKPVDFPGGYRFIQIDEETFALANLEKEHTRFDTDLRRQLQIKSPKDTAKMSRSWTVFALKPKKMWILVMTNHAKYFRFPYHYYRGEIKQNRSFIRDFVLDAVKVIVAKLPVKPPEPKEPKGIGIGTLKGLLTPILKKDKKEDKKE